METAAVTAHRFYVDGEAIEYWENPDLPFRCTPEELTAYAAAGSWDLLFNALTLMGAPVRSE
jgi:hypothetical protein